MSPLSILMSTETPQPDDADPSFEAARRALSFRFTEGQLQRMRELAEKATQGQLTSEERDEVECYERVGSLLGVLQSKARLILGEDDSSGPG